METSSKLIKIWMLALILGACSSQTPSGEQEIPEDLEEPNDFDYDVMSPDGIRVQTNGFTVPALTDLDTWFTEAEVCIGYATEERPNVVILEDLGELCGNGSTGIVCLDRDPIVMGIDDAYVNFEYQWKHEFIHYILHLNDYPVEDNRNHEPESLWDCQFQ